MKAHVDLTTEETDRILIRALEESGCSDVTSNKAALELMVERGAKAWKDVPDASAWVEELRGNDQAHLPDPL